MDHNLFTFRRFENLFAVKILAAKKFFDHISYTDYLPMNIADKPRVAQCEKHSHIFEERYTG